MCELCDSLNSGKVLAADDNVAILSASTAAPSVLVVAKQHNQLSELSRQAQEHLFTTASSLSSLIFDSIQAQGTNIIIQDTAHAAALVIARTEQDNLDLRWKPNKASPEDLQATAKRVSEEAWYIGKEEKKPAPVVAVAAEEPPVHTEEPKTSIPKDVAADIQKHVESGPKTEQNYLIRHLTRRR